MARRKLESLTLNEYLRKVFKSSLFCFFLKKSWYSHHASLNSLYKAWSYKKNMYKKIKADKKSVQKETKIKSFC